MKYGKNFFCYLGLQLSNLKTTISQFFIALGHKISKQGSDHKYNITIAIQI